MRRAAAILLALVSAVAVAAPATVAEESNRQRQAAERAGRARDMEALRGYVNRRDAQGIIGFRDGFSSGRSESEPLPADIEALVVENLADPVIGGAIAGFMQHGTYGSRQLFDLLIGWTRDYLATGREPLPLVNVAGLLVRTRMPGAEAPIQEVVARSCAITAAARRPHEVVTCDPMIRFLAARRFEPTRQWLAGQLARVPAEYAPFQYGDVDGFIMAIGDFRDGPSAEILVAWLETVASRASLDSTYRRAMPVIAALGSIDPAVPVDYLRLRRALARLPQGQLVRPMTGLIAARRDARGVETLVAFLDLPPDQWWSTEEVVRALRAVDSPVAWRSAQAQLRGLEKRGSLKAAQKDALRGLDQLVAEADGEPERQRQWGLKQEAINRLGPHASPLVEARRVAATDPEQAARLYRRAIDEATERVRRSPQTADGEGYRALWPTMLEAAVHDRYRRRNPRAALEMLRSLVKLSDELSWDTRSALLHWRMADILHFDLGDRAGAAREMAAEAAKARGTLGRVGGDGPNFFLQGLPEWMDAEARFLRDGKAFQGRLPDAVRLSVGFLAIMNADRLAVPPPLEPLVHVGLVAEMTSSPQYRSSVRGALAAIRPSRENASRGLVWFGLFRDEASLRAFFDKHDPAGIVTLVLMEHIAQLDRADICRSGTQSTPFPGFCDDLSRPHPAQEAARKILASRGGAAAAATGSPFATPAAAWATFIAALRAGDRQAALGCMTPELRERYRSVLQSLDAARMRAMADEFSPLAMGQAMGLFQEAHVTRSSGGRKQAALIYFLRQGGEWRINEM